MRLRSLIILSILISFLGCMDAPLKAQDPTVRKKRDERFKEMLDFKMKYLAQEMELKGEKRQKFIDLYTKMSQEKGKIFREADEARRKINTEGDKVSEEEYEKALETMDKTKEKDMEIEKKYEKEYKTFLTSKEIYKMHQAEEAFNQRLRQMHTKKKTNDSPGKKK